MMINVEQKFYILWINQNNSNVILWIKCTVINDNTLLHRAIKRKKVLKHATIGETLKE